MRLCPLALGAALTAGLAISAAAAANPPISPEALIAAAKRATLKEIDYNNHYCDGATRVAEWLKALTAKEARSITWSGGECEMPSFNGLDVKEWPYCAQATVTLIHPKSPDDKAEIEIYFEQPAHGRPRAAYAFRGIMMTREDGPDYERFRKDFEAEWRERFPDTAAPACQD